MIRIAFTALIFVLIGCSKTSIQQDPKSVTPDLVKSIVLAGSPQEKADCADAVKAQNGKILYGNDLGVLMTDVPAADLELGQCKATITPNVPVEVPKNVPGEKRGNIPDVSTILKLIPAEEIGARSFIAQNPASDGRGVKVGILDTGVELDHPLLRKTTTGEIKVVDFEDFSGEGKIQLAPVVPAADKLEVAGVSYSIDKVFGSDFRFALFKASSLGEADDLSAVDKFEDVGVLTYLSTDGKRYGRIDTNNDKSFSDEVELTNYADSHKFTKLGKKRLLTTSLNISKDGATATVCFDDGGHGTHVAGIATGYEEGGLSGVAPGAQVVAVKIGDNRLSGGSTTTASMMLAIDYAVSKQARILNLSYGIHSGSNVGKSAIDQYVDKVAKEKDVLFAISAGNEGPALLTVGTPAGANLAITNAAFISKETARSNYGYLGVQQDNTWFFSSVGPRQDGGFKPTLLAPGSAIASVPLWDKSYQNFRGTSMASPQVTGGLALVLSAAQAEGLPTGRAAITKAVYQSAKVIPNLHRIEQGHGLMNVPGAHAFLASHKDAVPVEYAFSVASPTSPDGKGQGIYIRDGQLPANNFSVGVTLTFPEGTPLAEQEKIRTYDLQATADWIVTPGTLWANSLTKSFQVSLDPSVLGKPGLHSEAIRGISQQTGEVEFTIPVTVVVPTLLSENNHSVTLSPTLAVGESQRFFVKVPAGTTGLALSLETDGPVAWAQLVDPEGRTVLELRETEVTPPMPSSRKLLSVSNHQLGVYELDLIAPPNIAKPVKATVKLAAYSLDAKVEGALGEKKYSVSITNAFDSIKVKPRIELPFYEKAGTHFVKGDILKLGFDITKEDLDTFSGIDFHVVTAKKIYDLMTDYPFVVRNPKGKVTGAGGLELNSTIPVELEEKTELGKHEVTIQGAFTAKAPESWAVTVKERRLLKEAKEIFSGNRTLVEQGQTVYIEADLTPQTLASGHEACPVIVFESPVGTEIQRTELCR